MRSGGAPYVMGIIIGQVTYGAPTERDSLLKFKAINMSLLRSEEPINTERRLPFSSPYKAVDKLQPMM